MTKTLAECILCKATVERENSDINRSKRNKSAIFCSRTCQYKHNRLMNSTECTCTKCNKTFVRRNSQVIRPKNHFCSHSCNSIYNAQHKTKGTRRSKLECYLEEQLSSLFPSLEIKYNCKTTIKSELDIYIPDLKLAIELNGIYHFKPIYGEKKLQKIQTNDLLKKEACTNQLITLVTIDTSSQKRYSHESSKEYLTSITELLSSYL